MKTTKTSVGIGPGKDGDEDPNKWTFSYKSTHANDDTPSNIELDYQSLLDKNIVIKNNTERTSQVLQKVFEKLGVNIRKLNELANEHAKNNLKMEKLQEEVKENTINIDALKTAMDEKIQRMSLEMSKKLQEEIANERELRFQDVADINNAIRHQNELINSQIEQNTKNVLANNETVVNNTRGRIDEIAENATSSFFRHITNFLTTFGGLFDTRIVGYIGITIITVSACMWLRSRNNASQIQTTPTVTVITLPATAAPINEASILQQNNDNQDNSSTIRSELRETTGIIVKLIKTLNKWLKILYEKQLDRLEKYKK